MKSAPDDTMDDVLVCKTRPIKDKSVRGAVAAYRKQRQFQFVGGGRIGKALPPVDNFMVALGLQPDERLRARVQDIFAAAGAALLANSVRCERGYIYVFHDSGDPANIVKIGRTSRTPGQRLAEWERQLAPEPGKSLRLLSAYPTRANRIAERVVQELLRCQRVENRINPLDNRQLDEFYRIDNVLALALFVRETLRYVDNFCVQVAAY